MNSNDILTEYGLDALSAILHETAREKGFWDKNIPPFPRVVLLKTSFGCSFCNICTFMVPENPFKCGNQLDLFLKIKSFSCLLKFLEVKNC